MKNTNHHKKPYTTFMLMLLFSAISMYITMYFNTHTWDHIYFSWTRMYMTIIGVAGMAIVMFLCMRHMYHNKAKNALIILGSFMVMGISTLLVRTQTPIDDVKWMKAMIPHHSIAVLTSSKADIKDPEVKQLAEDIIAAQKKEIAQMKKMIELLENME